MAGARQLILDLLARDKTGPATKGAADNLKTVGDAADKAAKDTERLGDKSDKTEDQVQRLGRSSRTAAEHVEGLDREIKSVERELQQLAIAFAEAETAADRLDLSRAIRRTEADLRRLNKSKGLIASILPDNPEPAAKSFMTKLGGALSAAGDSVATLAGNHVGITVGASAGIAAAPVLLGTLSTALSAGVGGIGIGAGIALAVSKDPEIKRAGADAGKQFMDAIGAGAQAAFRGPLLQSIGILSDAGDEVAARWTKAFAALGPSIVPLTRDIAAAGVRISDALAGVAEKSGPALQGLGDSVRLISGGVADFLSTVSDGSPQAAANLVLVSGALADLTRQTGNFLNFVNQAGSNPWLTGPLLPLLRDHYMDAAQATGTFKKHTSEAAAAMTDAAHAAYVEGNELTNLSADMRAQTDPVFGLLDAQNKLAEAQKNAAKATKEHGKNSKEADAALRELAMAAIEVEGKAGELAATSNGKLSPALRATLQAAGLTEGQINRLAGQFRNAKGAGDAFAKTYRAKVQADTATAESRIQHVRDLLAKVRSKKISVSVLVADSQLDKVYNTLSHFGGERATGGPVKRGKAYVVGEKRPEVFVPNQDGTIIPSIDQFSGGSGGGGVAAPARRQTLQLEVMGDHEIVQLFRRLIVSANLIES